MQNRVLLHACCGICSSYPIKALKEAGYEPVVYFFNPNIFPEAEYLKRLEAQKCVCEFNNCELIEENYIHDDFLSITKGLENEPEKGLRCEKCIAFRLNSTAQKAKALKINDFTTSIVISPHKNYEKITEIGMKIAKDYGINYLAIDFKKKDGFLKTNKLSKELGLYRQNYCGCEFSVNKENKNGM